jgi:peptidoglycan/xylan/chitin deacetylase (PgdA/CDA1 family)
VDSILAWIIFDGYSKEGVALCGVILMRMLFLKRSFLAILYGVRTVLCVLFRLPEVSVLVYHSVSHDDRDMSIDPEVLDAHLTALTHWGYHFVTLANVVAWQKGEGELPRKAVALTFDDGYSDNLTAALPILQKHNAPAMIFLVWEGMAQGYGDGLPLLDDAAQADLCASGLVEFGSHTRSHRMLDRVPPEVLVDEITRGKFRYFAYPGGHLDLSATQAVEREGYDAAFSIKPGLLRKGDYLFTLRRNVILRHMSLFDLRMRVSYAMHWYGRVSAFFKKYELFKR